MSSSSSNPEPSNPEPVYAGIIVEDTAGDEEYARLLQTQDEVVTARPVVSGYGRKMQSKSKRGKRPQRAVEINDEFRDTYPGVGMQPGYTPGIPNRSNTTSDYYFNAWRPRDEELIVRSDDSYDSFFLCLFVFFWVIILVILLICIWLNY